MSSLSRVRIKLTQLDKTKSNTEHNTVFYSNIKITREISKHEKQQTFQYMQLLLLIREPALTWSGKAEGEYSYTNVNFLKFPKGVLPVESLTFYF